MLKKMRIRVIIAAMLAFTLAVVLVATLVNVTNYFAYSRQADRIIDYVYLYHTKYDDRMQVFFVPAVEPFSGDLDEAERYMASFCLVNVNDNGEVMSSYMDHITSLSIETAYSYAQKIAKSNSDRGYYKEYRYAKKDIIGGNVIIFLDCSRDVASMRNVINMSIIISLGSLLLVFIMVVLLSRKAISPMAKNIELQKRFITDASHELKTPLTSISTSLDVIESEHGKSEWIDNIRQQVGRMSGMVSEMVTLSRLDEIKPVNEKEKFDLSTTSWEILEVHMPQAKARGIDIQTDIEDNIIIDGEKASIQELLSVLIDQIHSQKRTQQSQDRSLQYMQLR